MGNHRVFEIIYTNRSHRTFLIIYIYICKNQLAQSSRIHTRYKAQGLIVLWTIFCKSVSGTCMHIVLLATPLGGIPIFQGTLFKALLKTPFSLLTQRPLKIWVGTFGDPPNLTLTHLTRRLTLILFRLGLKELVMRGYCVQKQPRGSRMSLPG